MVDVLVVGSDVVTMDPDRRVLRDAAVAITRDVITEIGDARELRSRYPTARVLGWPTAVVTPGYINAHQHLTGHRLIRSSIPDYIDAGAFEQGWSATVHAAMTDEDDELSATLSLLEAARNGVTTTIEAGTAGHPERVAAAMRRVGVRGAIGHWGWDVGEGVHVAPAAEVIARQQDLIDRFPAGSTIEAWVTLVGHDLMSDELVVAASRLARERGSRLTFHMSSSPNDADAFLARTGRRPLVHLEELGALGPHVLVAHAVHLDAAEVAAVVRTGTAVVACPWAYLRLAQGATGASAHRELWRAGARLALGCDSENASDALDPLRAAALFIGLLRDQTGDPRFITSHHALELLTIRAAEAIGWSDRIGSLEVGKQADIVTHRTDQAQWLPLSPNPVRQLVWASDGRSINDVVVAGRSVVANGRWADVDIEELRRRARRRSDELFAILLMRHADRERVPPGVWRSDGDR